MTVLTRVGGPIYSHFHSKFGHPYMYRGAWNSLTTRPCGRNQTRSRFTTPSGSTCASCSKTPTLQSNNHLATSLSLFASPRGTRTYTTKATANVTLESIFSEVNKKRCQENIYSVRPVRDVTWKVKGKLMDQAAVLIPLCCVKGEPSLLYTVRSSALNSQPGEVSFPGGRVDTSDPDRTFTALRETHEEVGIEPSSVDVWGSLVPVPGKNYAIAVTPVLGLCGELDLDVLDHNKHEVDKVFVRSIASLCDSRNQFYTTYRTGPGYTLPVFLGGEDRIWGMTAIITHQLLTLLAPGLYNFEVPAR